MSHRMFFAKLDALGSNESVFTWEDGGKHAAAKLPRDDWENAGRPLVVTVVLADLAGARIDDTEALSAAWNDGYKHGGGDAQRDDDMHAVNPHWVKR